MPFALTDTVAGVRAVISAESIYGLVLDDDEIVSSYVINRQLIKLATIVLGNSARDQNWPHTEPNDSRVFP